MTKSVLTIAIAGCALIGLALAAKARFDAYEPEDYTGPRLPKPAQSAQIGQILPPIDLVDMQGDHVSIGGPRNRPLLVHYWASWCLPCVQDLPTYAAAAEALARRGIDLVTVAQDDRGHAQAVIEREKLQLSVLITDGARVDPVIASGSGFGAIPYNVVLDTRGQIRAQQLGAIPGGKQGLIEWAVKAVQ